jgi:hypothetical protein
VAWAILSLLGESIVWLDHFLTLFESQPDRARQDPPGSPRRRNVLDLVIESGYTN